MNDPHEEPPTTRSRAASLGDKVDIRQVLDGPCAFRLQFTDDSRSKEMKWVLFTENRRGAIGKIIFTLEANNSAHVKSIDIHQNYRSFGLSKILFFACMATLKQHNVHELCLEAEEDTRRHHKLVGLYESWGFSVKQNAKILFLYNDTQCFRKVPMALPLLEKTFVPLEPMTQQSFCMISLRTMDGVFVVASEDGMIDTTKGKSRDVFWQTMLLNDDVQGSTICLRSAHGKFLCVEPVGTVLADRFVNSTWETFDVLPHPTSGGVALRSFHGNYLGLDDVNGLVISQEPVAWDGETISLMCNKANPIPVHVKLMRKYQTKIFSENQLSKYGSLDHAHLTIEEACKTLMQLNGESGQRSNSRVLQYMLYDAEAIRMEGHPDWMQLIAFLRGLGMIFLLWTDQDNVMLRSISFEQWLSYTITWVTGIHIPDEIDHASLNELNADHTAPKDPYEAGKGMSQVVMPWTPEEYLYHVLKGNATSLPEDALLMLRFFSCEVWYKHHCYSDLTSPSDMDVQDMVHGVQLGRKAPSTDELLDTNVEELLPYYISLCEKYLPLVMNW
ncbi:inositol oxygenase [Thraustotheca clavata]|uniref:Inositol oxygenase n=1 Tax=Thraustotheca clavata TaxID=74557 RepID=A0A1V9ZRG9_9STRA|nr:inositol oxygenase [Thraustotheca clavata]